MPLCPKEHLFGHPLLDDFRNYLHHALNLLKGVDPTPVQYDVADWIWRGGARDLSSVPKKRVTEMLRAGGKSTITGIYVPWEVRRAFEYTDGHPDLNVMTLSGRGEFAGLMASFIRDLIQADPFLMCMVPEDPDEKWSGQVLNVKGRVPGISPTVYARALFSQITGYRAHLVVADDVEIPQTSETQGMRTKLRLRMEELVDILEDPQRDEIVILGTPQIEDTFYNVVEEWGFARRKWPARYPDVKWMAKQGHLLAPFLKRKLDENPELVGEPTEPTRFPQEALLERERVSKSRFALQNMLDTSLADEDRYPLKLRDLIVMDLEGPLGPELPGWTNDPDRRHDHLTCVGLAGDEFYAQRQSTEDLAWAPYDFVVCGVDPSGRGKSETSWSIVAALGGMVYLLRNVGMQGGYGPAVLDKLMDDLVKYGVQQTTAEDNLGDGMFTGILRASVAKRAEAERTRSTAKPWPGCGVLETKQGAQKELRIIETLEPVTQNHRLVVATSVIRDDIPGFGEMAETHRLWFQFTRIERLKDCLVRYDRVDSLAIAVKALQDRLGLRADHAVRQRTSKEEREMMLEHWRANSAGGLRPPEQGHAGQPGIRGRRRSQMGARVKGPQIAPPRPTPSLWRRARRARPPSSLRQS